MLVMTRHAVNLCGLSPPGITGLETIPQRLERPLAPGRVAETQVFVRHRFTLRIKLRRRVERAGQIALGQRQRMLRQQHLPTRRYRQVHGPIGIRQRQGNGRQAHAGLGKLRVKRLVD